MCVIKHRNKTLESWIFQQSSPSWNQFFQLRNRISFCKHNVITFYNNFRIQHVTFKYDCDKVEWKITVTYVNWRSLDIRRNASCRRVLADTLPNFHGNNRRTSGTNAEVTPQEIWLESIESCKVSTEETALININSMYHTRRIIRKHRIPVSLRCLLNAFEETWANN